MSVPAIDIDQLAELDPRSLQLVDVREPDEFEAARVPGARLVPLGSVPERLDEFDQSRPIHLICAAGVRSMHAAVFLAEQGFDVVNVDGGTNAWIGSGRDVERGPATP